MKIIYAITMLVACSAAQQTEEITGCSITAIMKEKILLGEPLIADVTIKNESGQAIDIEFGDLFMFYVKDEKGQSVNIRQYWNTYEKPETIRMQPGEVVYYKQPILADIKKTGEYIVTIKYSNLRKTLRSKQQTILVEEPTADADKKVLNDLQALVAEAPDEMAWPLTWLDINRKTWFTMEKHPQSLYWEYAIYFLLLGRTPMPGAKKIEIAEKYLNQITRAPVKDLISVELVTRYIGERQFQKAEEMIKTIRSKYPNSYASQCTKQLEKRLQEVRQTPEPEPPDDE